jgi:hypothetical protein
MTGFDACRLIRQAIRSNTVDRAHLEEVEEALKQLGWGPSGERSAGGSGHPPTRALMPNRCETGS